MKQLRLVPAAMLMLAVFSCKQETKTTEQKFIETSQLDSSVKPGDNFFLFVNGKWLQKAEIPATESSIGSFLDIYNRTKDHIKTILDSVSKANNTAGTIEQKVGDFYASGMDSATIEKRGYEPVKPYLQKIDGLTDSKDIMQFVAEQQVLNNNLLFSMGVGADEKNSSMNIALFYQGGLGLPDRDYYFKTDAPTLDIVKAYKAYIQKLFTLTGTDSATAAKNAETIFAFEKQMAGSHRTNVELRDPQSNYHKLAVTELDKKQPVFAWTTLLNNLNIKSDSVNVGQPAFYGQVNELLKTTPLDTWKIYLRFHVLADAATALSSPFVDAAFNYSKVLSGQQKQKPRWERIYRRTDANLGEALGQLYVKKYFTAEAKQRMLELVNNLQTAFDARIGKLDWMSDSTKAKAKEKLHAFIKKIGYPDKWRDYSKVTINKGTYFENLVSAAKNEYEYNRAKIGKPVDKTEWGMTPPTINAYYNPVFNEIVFPAGILQAPFFDLTADDAMNYGAIGMAIGHEMTHGFDDQGAQYDKDGNLKNWWSKEDYTKFQAKSKQVIDLYNSFTILDTVHINGALTTGENMADIGGIAIAYDAFKLTKQGKDTARIDGLTPDQRFFISLGLVWREKVKPETERLGINTDPHSPGMWRVNGPLMNFEPFYKAFNVQAGEKMYVADDKRIKIW
ncbi:M13 family metallopeptidase [Danxiaibacter flavus]|uniref:M13 family metallopeptidase n=1 Tax=Danxiaibacter flavus TaxID=3049108 RepID=A0ABV3ZGJ1_9BACT|nr:M13 family metallopeptidase [Chitinophagaceae bacterium DXS]